MIGLRHAVARTVAAAALCLGASCAGPGPAPREPPGDTLIVQASSAARRAYEVGEFEQARGLYRRALVRARTINHAGHAADAAFNLAMSEIALGNYGVAERLLFDAQYDAGRAGAETVDILLLRAKVAYLRQRLQDALAFIQAVVAAAAPQRIRLQAIILRGQIGCESGDAASGAAELRAAKALAASENDELPPAISADLAKLEGTVARLTGRADDAALAFDAEAELLRASHRYRDMGYALARAADAHLAGGRPALAADRFFLAARSLDARGETDRAQALLASSLSAAKEGGDEGARARAQLLLDDIKRRVGP